MLVRAVDTCSTCNGYLMTKPFHLFNCGHKFHTSCLIDEVTPFMTPGRRKKLDEVLAELRAVENKTADDVVSIDSKSAKLSRKEQLRAELDDLVAGECISCGDLIIRTIDVPLIDETEFDDALREWL